MSEPERIFYVNGKEIRTRERGTTSLLRFLRDNLHLTGTKCGCDRGECGACTVILDGKAVRSCRIRLDTLDGRHVTTIEGLSRDGKLHPLQQAFLEKGAVQCGFCTPGMIMASKALLDVTSDPSEEDIKRALSGNLCRCTGYRSIIDAVREAAKVIKEGGISPMPRIEEPSGIGFSPLDKEGIEKVTGSLRFAGDLYREGMLYGKLLLTPLPSARLEAIRTEEAERIPGVVKILTSKDVPGLNRCGRMIPNQPVLVENKIRFIGDVLAVAFAETLDIANEAVSRIKVELVPEEGIYSPLEALDPQGPAIHEDGNIMKSVVNEKGDIDEGFANSDIIEEHTYFTPFVEHAYLEPEAGLAYIDDEGRITVHFPTQAPFHVRKQVADSLALPEEKVRIVTTPLGGGFGGKTDVTIEILLALGAYHTGKPVKITLERNESLRISTKRHPFYMRYKTGATKDGRLMALRAKFLMDVGAYAGISPGVLEQATIFACGPYVWPNLRVEGIGVYTNNVLGGAFRGFGINQVHFAIESQMDRIARRLGMDPFEFRLKNALDVGLETSTGEVLRSSVAIKETIRRAREALEFELKKLPALPRWKRYGIGVASGYKNVGYGRAYSEYGGAILELTEEGKVWLRVSAVDMGQGVGTVLSQMVTTETGIDYRNIRVTVGDTALVPEGVAAVAQRQTYIVGNATIEASRRFKENLLELASRELDTSYQDLNLQGERIVTKDGSRYITLEQLFERLKARGETLRVESHYSLPPTHPIRGDKTPTYLIYQYGHRHPEGRISDGDYYRNYITYSYVTQVAIVEVDTRTGEVRVRKIIAAHDVGRALNPKRIKGQLEGSLMMGVGYALSEEFRMREGYNLTRSLRDCGVPGIEKTPEMEVIVIEDPEPEGPFGAKGMSEVALVPTAPAITNAIYDAVGVRVDSLPATPSKILDGLRHKVEFK